MQDGLNTLITMKKIIIKHYYALCYYAILIALCFNFIACTGGDDNKTSELLGLIFLAAHSPVMPIEPDPAYTGSNCSCGTKTSSGSSLSVSQSTSVAGAVKSAGRLNKAYVPDEVLVKFKGGVSLTKANQIMNSLGGSHIKNLAIPKQETQSLIKHIKLNNRKSVEQAVAEYSGKPEVEYAQPNYIYRALATYPDDPDFGNQWGLHNTGQTLGENTGIAGKDIHAPEAWDVITDCSNVIVAVVDSGINYNQRDLAGNMWNGGSSYPNHGYDFADNDDDPMDLSGHGTHVAGIIGADGNNGTGLCGVCWKVKLMAVRVLDAVGNGTTATIVSGIDFAVTNGAHVINLSLGDGIDDAAMKTAIESARASGVIVVAAAGNGGSTSYIYPAAYTKTSICGDCDNVISVGAIDQRGNLAGFSSYGTDWVDIAAPGASLLSTWAGQSVTTRENFGDWTLGNDWGTGNYPFNGPFGLIYFTLLTNPSQFGWSAYQPYQNSAAYKVFDLGAYGAASARVNFFLIYELYSSDSLVFTANTNAAAPDVSDGIFTVNDSSGGLLYEVGFDLTKYLGPHTSMGFLFLSYSDWVSLGAGIGLFETTRLYLNTTACRYLDGTSMAAPHVSGAAALCIAQYISKYGSYTRASHYSAIINAILNNYDNYAGLNSKITNGRMLNVSKAVQGI